MNNSTEVILHDNHVNDITEDKLYNKEKKNPIRSIYNQSKLIYTNFFKASTVLALFTAFFAWSTYYYQKENDSSWDTFKSSTCNGFGFLVILYGLFIFGYFKVYFWNPKIRPVLSLIYKPFSSALTKFISENQVLTVVKRYSQEIFYVIFVIGTGIYLGFDTSDNRNRLIPISGLFVFLFIGYLFSNNKSKINWHTVIWGIILQFIFGLLTIRWEVGRNILDCIGDKVNTLLNYAFKAAEFPYGTELIANQQVFAFRALSTVYFISFLVNILYYYGIMQKVVGGIGSFLQWIMGTSICESVNSAANIFLGMTEAPLLLAPYLKNLTDSEIHSIMTSGFATVAGSVMAGYISFGARPQDLITASIMSSPAALCYSKLMYPETEEVKMHKENIDEVEVEYESVLDAASKGVSNAIGMVHGIVAGLIAFVAAVYFINGVLGWMGELVGYTDPVWTLKLITGKIFIPISFIMGVPWSECEHVGTLIGVKTMVNEFVAFQQMGEMLKQGLLSERTKVIATYAICGFSNPASIGIMISGLITLIPNKRDVITRVVFRAWFGGALVCFMTACIAGAVMPENAI